MTSLPQRRPWRARFAVAPMMDWTDRHCRVFHRVLSRHARLYTEMVTSAAIMHGDKRRLLDFDAREHPVAIQLGGSDPRELAAAARLCESWGYDEINLNVGCPSERVRSGAFGACLMREPALVGDCVAALKAAVGVPVTVKCRLGVDDQPDGALAGFADAVIAAGVDGLVVHARKAWLTGLSPRENRDVPPLNYPLVYALKAAHPDLPIVLNGGLSTPAAIDEALRTVDGVMLGRAAYGDPSILLDVDHRLFGESAAPSTRCGAVHAYLPYVTEKLGQGVPLHAMTRHMLGLFNGCTGARAWRRHLSTQAVKPGAGAEIVIDALAHISSPKDSLGAVAA